MTRDPWFCATWTGFMPVHRTGWILVLSAAAVVTVAAALGVLLFSRTQEPLYMYGPAGLAMIVVVVVFVVAFTRTKWG